MTIADCTAVDTTNMVCTGVDWGGGGREWKKWNRQDSGHLKEISVHKAYTFYISWHFNLPKWDEKHFGQKQRHVTNKRKRNAGCFFFFFLMHLVRRPLNQDPSHVNQNSRSGAVQNSNYLPSINRSRRRSHSSIEQRMKPKRHPMEKTEPAWPSSKAL